MLKYLYLLLLSLCITPLHAQRKIELSGWIVNYLTRQGVDSVRVELLNSDSTYICDAHIHKQKVKRVGNVERMETLYMFELSECGHYLLRATHPKFETEYAPVDVVVRPKAIPYVEGPEIVMKRKVKIVGLGEVVVNATKVKFYQRGDTLVYNADAFELAEGSMLDALISQLPGAELKSDGRIFVNGRFVESLLLNGKDFFRGDNRVMLDNLPAYMVKDVKVYDRHDEFRPHDKTIYTMDVGLKKEYEVGWLANFGGGYGTDDRYMARLFALRFTRQSRIALFGNMNNVNVDHTPGLDGEWNPAYILRGILTTRKFGMDYMVDDKYQHWSINGNTVANFSDSKDRSLTRRENYLTGGNTYGQSYSRVDGCSYSVRTDNKLTLNLKNVYVRLQPQASFSKTKNNGEDIGATFSSDPETYAGGWELIDSIRSLHNTEVLRRIAINRTMEQSMYRSTDISAGTTYRSYIYVGAVGDRLLTLKMDGGVNYRHHKRKDFNQYSLDYFGVEQPADKRNRFNEHPTEHFDVNTSFDFSSDRLDIVQDGVRLYITPSYGFSYRSDDETFSRYRLDRLSEWAVNDENTLGQLPPANLLAQALDAPNSYRERSHELDHTAALRLEFFRYNFGPKRNIGMETRLRLPLLMTDEHTDYLRASIDTTFQRKATFFNPSIDVMFDFFRKSGDDMDVGSQGTPTVGFSYNLQQTLPRHTLLLDIRDDSNPLYITHGNPNLRRTQTHNFRLYFWKRPQGGIMCNASLNYRKVDHAVVMGYVYDRQTAVRTVTPSNIEGNWDGNASLGLTFPLDAKRRWSLEPNLGYTIIHNVDLVGVAGESESCRRAVDSRWGDASLRLNFRPSDKASFAAKAKFVRSNIDSRAEDFLSVHATDFSFFLGTVLSLPGNFGLSTDLTLYSRRGYNDRLMNTDELVWNARLTRSFLKGRLLLAVDGVDLLGQLSNVHRSVNAQGRVETLYNVIQHYAMFTATYKLSKQPKRK